MYHIGIKSSKKIRDPGSTEPRIRNLGGSWILCFHFHVGSYILDPVTATWSWDPGELGSQTEKMLLDPGDPGSCLDKLSKAIANFGSFPTMMLLYLEDPLHQIKFCFLNFLNLSTVQNLDHILITNLYGLETSTTCWFLIMLLYLSRSVVNRM